MYNLAQLKVKGAADVIVHLKSRFYNQEYQVQDCRSNAVFASSAEKAAHMIAVTKCFEISRQCDVRDNKIEPDDLRMPQPCLISWKRYFTEFDFSCDWRTIVTYYSNLINILRLSTCRLCLS